MPKLIIGLGTGRCGTRSLAKLLDSHDEISAGHEQKYMLWDPDAKVADKFLRKLLNNGSKLSADVGFYWINYVDHISDNYPGTKFICLKREKEKVIESFMRGDVNPMHSNLILELMSDKITRLRDTVTQEELYEMDENTREWVETYWDEPMLDNCILKEFFPNYDGGGRRDYLSRYYDDYYEKAKAYAKKYMQNFVLMDMDFALNSQKGINTIFNFIGAH